MAELQVFHNIPLRIATNRFKHAAPNKNPLIAGGNTGEPRAEIHQPADHPEGQARRVHMDVKTAAHNLRVG